ncbi:membrane protein [Mycobacterium haemophilum DSM 44634]|nr:VIT1/CCC1 transporter family protein [Mycobacterium haemophilum DSM 44634]
MDGLVGNTGLIAGVAAGEGGPAITVSGIAGLLAGAFSTVLGEYSSVTTATSRLNPRCTSNAERYAPGHQRSRPNSSACSSAWS